MIVPLGYWVFEQACLQARRWDLAPSDARPHINVNVSGRQVQQPEFVGELRRMLRATDVQPQRLTLEFTESVLMRDTEKTLSTLSGLKRLGVRLAIDDFGTGYSSLSYLRRFPIDELKIDRSFIASMQSGPAQLAVVRSIVKLGETLHLETVAEGIEKHDAARQPARARGQPRPGISLRTANGRGRRERRGGRRGHRRGARRRGDAPRQEHTSREGRAAAGTGQEGRSVA